MAQKGVSGMGSSDMFHLKTEPCLFKLTLKSLSSLYQVEVIRKQNNIL